MKPVLDEGMIPLPLDDDKPVVPLNTPLLPLPLLPRPVELPLEEVPLKMGMVGGGRIEDPPDKPVLEPIPELAELPPVVPLLLIPLLPPVDDDDISVLLPVLLFIILGPNWYPILSAKHDIITSSFIDNESELTPGREHCIGDVT